jgi:hypothetical protein
VSEIPDDKVNWQRRPSKADALSKFRIQRAPSKAALVARILSHEFTGARTHYWGGRTRPCDPILCEACDNNQASRWHGWLFAQDLKTLEVYILEFPPAVGCDLDRKFGELRTLRGVHFKVFRVGGKANSRVVIQFGPQDQDRDALPKVPALEPILCSIWGIRGTSTKKSPRMTDHDVERRDDDDSGETFLREHD